jgi:hypothetical protein
MKAAASLVALLLLAAGPASAAEPSGALKPPLAALDLSTPSAGFAPAYSHAPPARIPGVARTAIDRRLDDDAVGSIGFMCGLKPGAEKSGAAAAHGYDPTGRFVGARLRFAFR